MTDYEPGFEAHRYGAVREAILDFARTAGRFDANAVLVRIHEASLTVNPGTVAEILDELTGAGHLEKVEREPPVWQLAREDQAPASPGG